MVSHDRRGRRESMEDPVLILIVMDNGLSLCSPSKWRRAIISVLILIVMDNGLSLAAVFDGSNREFSLNPYCNG